MIQVSADFSRVSLDLLTLPEWIIVNLFDKISEKSIRTQPSQRADCGQMFYETKHRTFHLWKDLHPWSRQLWPGSHDQVIGNTELPNKWAMPPKNKWRTMCVLIYVQLLVSHALWSPLPMGCSRQEDWNGLPFPFPGDLPDPGIEPKSPALAGGFFTTHHQGRPYIKSFQRKKDLCHPKKKKKEQEILEFPGGNSTEFFMLCRQTFFPLLVCTLSTHFPRSTSY